MVRLVLIRHGQASYGQADYDRLSPLGEKQSRLLGAYWAERGVSFDRAYVGPCRRHRQTYDAVAAEYRSRDLDFPTATLAPGLDEYPAFEIMDALLPPYLATHLEDKQALERVAGDRGAEQREYFRIFRAITGSWARGELETPGLESWSAFRVRVSAAVDLMKEPVAADGRGEMVAAFTSGGPVSAAAGYALGLSNEKTIELSWVASNGSFTEIIAAPDRFSLWSFNCVPHLDDPALVTGA